MTPKRIAIINFTGFRANWGCQATSFELLKFVAACFPDDQPLDVSFVPLLATSRFDASMDPVIDRVYDAFSAVARQTESAPSQLRFLEEVCVARYGHWADKVRSADLVVFQAEGSMGLGTSFAHAPRLMLLPFVAKHAWGRQVISLNQTFYSQDERVVRNAVDCFSTLDLAAFREPLSVALAKSNGVRDAVLIPDLAFMAPQGARPSCGDLEQDQWFAISGSALKDPDRYRLIMKQAKRIARETGLRPLISVSRDLQLKLSARLSLRPGTYRVVPSASTYPEVAAAFARCAFLLGGRYHMTIVAAAVGTPSIILTGNSIKNEGLARLIGAGRPVRSFADEDGIVADAVQIIGTLAQQRRDLQERLAWVRDRIAVAQDHVSALIAGSPHRPLTDRDMPEFEAPEALIERYRRFGSGKKEPRKFVFPGRRLGSMPSVEQILAPLLSGLPNDRERTEKTLRALGRGMPELGAALQAGKLAGTL